MRVLHVVRGQRRVIFQFNLIEMKKVKNLFSLIYCTFNFSIGLFGMQEIGYFSGITHGLFPVISNIKSMS
jgi:hypothetical protein